MPTVRKAIQDVHLANLRRGDRVAARFDRVAADLRDELARIAAERKADAVRRAAQRFGEVAAQFVAETHRLLRLQAARTAREVLAALNRNFDQRRRLDPVILAKVAPVQTPDQQKSHYGLLVAGLLGFVTASVAMAAAGQGTPGVDIAVNRLAGRAKRNVRYGTLAVTNRTTRTVIEQAVPVAKPAELAAHHIVPRPPVTPTVTPTVTPARGPNLPAPGEPEFIILPEPRTVPPVDPTTPPPVDPDPMTPIPAASNLIGWQVLSMLLPTTREKHRHRHRDTFYYHPRPERGEKGMEYCPNPPYESPADGGVMAWNCLLPDMRIQGRFKRLFNANYSGEAVEFRCASGEKLFVTANHPVLTLNGFVPATQLGKGQYAIRYERHVEPVWAVEDKEDIPPRIEDVFRSCEKFAWEIATRPTSGMEFHNDAKRFQGNITRVASDRKLWRCLDAQRTHVADQFLFVGPHMGKGGVSGLGPFKEFYLPRLASANGSMSGGDLRLACLRVSDPTPYGCLGFGLRPHFDTTIPEAVRDKCATHPALFGQPLDRLSGDVLANYLVQIRNVAELSQTYRFGGGADRDARIDKSGLDSIAFHPMISTDGSERFAATISPDAIVEVNRFHYDGPVYDGETDSGYYIAGSLGHSSKGIVLSNCVCILRPLFLEDGRP